MIPWLLAASDPISHVAQHTVLDLNPGGGAFSFPVLSNHIVMQVLGGLILILFIPAAVRQRRARDGMNSLVPRGSGTAIESICVGLREFIFKPNLGPYTDRFTPYLWSLFFFILISNILGLFPLSDWLYFLPHPILGGTSTANIWVTGTLAALTLILMVYNGLKFNGTVYLKHFFLGPWWIAWFVAIIEIVGVFFKAVALAVRLMANMLAGHILLAVLLSFVEKAYAAYDVPGAIAIGIPVLIGMVLVNFLEILVAFLHAFIFTTLTVVFLGQAVNIHHDDHEHEHAEEHEHGHAEPRASGGLATAH